MRLIMKITKTLSMERQKTELNILDALTLIEQTVTSLERIRASESEMNSQIDASAQFAKTRGLDPQVESSQKRQRKPSRRIDANLSTSAAIQFHPYYCKCMIEVLDSMIREYKDDINDCLGKVKPLAEALVLPNHHLKKLTVEEAEAISEIFPPSVAVNPVCLVSEFEFFRNLVQNAEEPCMTVHDICQLAYKYKSIFPGVYKSYKLLLTAPVTVATNERTFCKMKIIKNFLRSTMSGKRLDDLIVLVTEKDLSDKIDLNMALKARATKKNRKRKLSVKARIVSILFS